MLGHSLLIAGIRGAGKSSALNMVVARLLNLPPELVELYLGDPLEGIDMGCWWWAAKKVAKTPDEVVDMLEERAAAVASRSRMLAEREIQKLAHPTPEMPARVILIDELAQVTTHPDERKGGLRQRGLHALWQLNAQGRKTGDILICATQDVRTTVLPDLIRGQFTQTLGLRCRTANQTEIVFGAGAKGEGVNLAKIPPEHPGRGWWADGHFTEIRVAGLYGQALADQVADLKAARQIADETPTVQGSECEETPTESRPSSDSGASSPPRADDQTSDRPPSAPTPPKSSRVDPLPVLFEALSSVNGVGLKASELMSITGLGKDPVYRGLNVLLEGGIV
jgi:S-DNA-T family DNA segregation ATPase FtsK/SpoIIIE